jgi:hypothetical protein
MTRQSNSTSQAIKRDLASAAKNNQGDGKNSLSEQFHQFIVGKVIDWALRERVAEGRFSAFKWGQQEQTLLNQIIENPKAAGLNLPIQDTKFKRFFKSIAENGLNTLDVQMFYRYRDRLPLRQLQWEFKKEDFAFTKQKLISKEIIPAGYYMLEVGIRTSAFSSQLHFDLQTPPIHSKKQTFELRVRSNRICKRLIYISTATKLEAVLSEQIGVGHIYHLRLARLTQNFFMSRMMNKIGKQFDVKIHENIPQDEFEVLWNRYDYLFQKNKNPFSEYEYFIKQVEEKQIPSRAEQLRNLQLWKIKNR